MCYGIFFIIKGAFIRCFSYILVIIWRIYKVNDNLTNKINNKHLSL
ncbi:hypothetical protein NLO413_0301 [Candidatus Neoehrlichia lotoris str. RAC413]|uniref:Uncharacterized protein n=1 Tax=Candidatus Neoehrlichia procyonis str. RAC413 TaxID=1359163 RepID=A0A0F3NLK7_9RICK|nr:hypothetical protein NLO413_0301 [Candidatus Neoehrlichia lotoris str. RAC413]